MAWLTLLLALAALATVRGECNDLDAEIKRLKAGTTQCPNAGQLCICAFNIKTFGQTKMEDQDVVDILVQVSISIC